MKISALIAEGDNSVCHTDSMISNFTNAPSFLFLVKYYIIRVKDTQQPIRVQRQASIRMFNIQEAKGINATLFSGLQQVYCKLIFLSHMIHIAHQLYYVTSFNIIRQNHVRLGLKLLYSYIIMLSLKRK